MEYVELDNLSDEAILNLYDDVIAWGISHCDGTGAEFYTNGYYGAANRYGYYTSYRPQGMCFSMNTIVCDKNGIDCCEPNEECSCGYSLKYGSYVEFFQEEL